jgi:transcription-repair coupling factor (superfamily II helicase)
MAAAPPGPSPWAASAEILRSSPPYRRLRERGGAAVRLPLAAAGWVVDLLSRELRRPALVVVPHEADLQIWLEAAALFGTADRMIDFPSPSLSPYQETEGALQVLAAEAAALDRLRGGRLSVVCTPRALFRRLPPTRVEIAGTLDLAVGEERRQEDVLEKLVLGGYRREDLVLDVGSFAARGGVVDVFPPGSPLPLRLDWFGDTIESIRAFEPESQRSLEARDAAHLPPLLPFPTREDTAQKLANELLALAGDNPPIDVREKVIALRRDGQFPGWHNYLPLVANDTTSLVDWFGGDEPWIVAVDPPGLVAAARTHAARLAEEAEARREHGKLWAPPEAIEQPLTRVLEILGQAELSIGDPLQAAGDAAADFAGGTTDLFRGQMQRFPHEIDTARKRGDRLVVVAPGESHARLREYLGEAAEGAAELVDGELERGFRLPPAGLVVYGESQLLAAAAVAPLSARRGGGKRKRRSPFVSGLRDLKIGDFVVHADHGIGQFVALRRVGLEPTSAVPSAPATLGMAPAAAGESEVMEISYAQGKRLLLPLERLDQLQKYSGIEGVAPRLDQLGGSSWNKTKARVKKGMRDMAEELLRLYAERQVAKAPPLPPDSDALHQFEAAFPYDETPDQIEAITAIREDLERERPMDRLLCGDVGYGKTEVAMRAAFKVVDGGHQVAILCPTTILADQHWETFKRRFAGFPIEVEMLSRFRTAEETRDVKKRVEAGKVDILIGTHRLLSKDVHLPRLGLVVIDEEQRFGVAQKERLKQLKKQVHVLALSATPVPRTLQFSLAGVRDLSVIETPPRDRMAVETAILPFSAELVREAIRFELDRGGQIYYVHHRVETIDRVATWLKELMPGLRVTIGHGQLDEKELAERMHAFTAGQHDVLLATTIIENGIDIPNVNTMIVGRADRFGLSQLYQLRGRVGRSRQLGYCYLMVEPDRVLSEASRKRLDALREFTELGAGFRIAARDLEIRGAGNLLGGEQSGHIATVGIETYMKLLEESVRELRGEAPDEAPSAQIDLGVSASIPVDYITDANLRMETYRRIASGEATEEGAAGDLLAELEDRFGRAPEAVARLLDVADVKRRAERLRVQQVAYQPGRLTLRLRQDARIDVDRLIRMVQTTDGAAFSPTGVLTLAVATPLEALERARATLDFLAAPSEPEPSAARSR